MLPHLEILVFLALLGLLGVFYLFGYIKPFQPELKIAEFDTYKAVYCGLCKQLGRSFGPFSRLTLSYDFTFLAMAWHGLTEDEPSWSRQRCFVNPLKKKACFFPCGGLSFAADAAMIMFYHKVRDNMADDGLKAASWAILSFRLWGAHAKSDGKPPGSGHNTGGNHGAATGFGGGRLFFGGRGQ